MTTKLTWLGHSAWQLIVGGKSILLDPFLTGNPAAVVSADSLSADYILVSHGHSDHVGDTVSVALRTGAQVISNPEITEWLEKQGVENVHPMNIGGSRDFPFGRVKLTIAHHSSMLPDGANGGNPCGFLLRPTGGPSIYFACDTGLFYDMQLIGEEGLDVAVLPIGDNYTMGPDDALRAVRLLQPRRVIPTHYNTWPLIAADPHAWAACVRAEAAAEPIVLAVGQTYDL